MTTRYHITLWVMRILDWLLSLTPAIIFCVLFIRNISYKETNSWTAYCAIVVLLGASILFGLSMIKHCKFNTAIWLSATAIAIISKYLAIYVVIITVAIALDEFIIVPLRKRYHELYTIQHQIDKRKDAELRQAIKQAKKDEQEITD